MIQVVIARSPGMFVSTRGQKKIFQCPHCSSYNHFYVSGTANCRVCRQILPNVYALMENEYYRKKWHLGEHE